MTSGNFFRICDDAFTAYFQGEAIPFVANFTKGLKGLRCYKGNRVVRYTFKCVSLHGWCCSEESDARQAGAAPEGVFPDASNAITNRDARQIGAEAEGTSPDAGDAIANRDARQATAVVEGLNPEAGDAIRDRDARQAGAFLEGALPDAGDAVRDRDARQAGAAEATIEGIIPDAGDRFTFNGVWND